MTVEQPINTAHVWTVNATEVSVDFYVNYGDEPAITDAKPMEIGPIFTVDGTLARPYGVYTISARLKDDLGGPVLAAASIDLQQTLSFAGVLHALPGGGYQFSIYENDFTASADTRLTLFHNAEAGQLDWQIFAEPGENPEIPDDPRSGSLMPGEWQEALDVTENQYVLEVFEDGQLVARFEGLELETEKNLNVYIVGDPEPTSDPLALVQHLLDQEYQIPAGAKRPDVVSDPAPPHSSTDSNAAVEFTCEALEIWETNATSATVTAVDPDGWVNNLSIDRIDPDLGSIEIPDNGVTLSSDVGEPATAQVDIGGDVPSGHYAIRVISNYDTVAQRETCTLHLEVKPITIGRLESLVQGYKASEDVTDSFADKLLDDLAKAEAHLNDDEVAKACRDLTKFQDRVGNQSGSKIAVAAADDLLAESDALKADLVCG